MPPNPITAHSVLMDRKKTKEGKTAPHNPETYSHTPGVHRHLTEMKQAVSSTESLIIQNHISVSVKFYKQRERERDRNEEGVERERGEGKRGGEKRQKDREAQSIVYTVLKLCLHRDKWKI